MSIKRMTSAALMGAVTFVMATSAMAQEAVVELLAAPAGAEEWNVVSRSSATVYMVDVKSITSADGITSIKLARVPATGDVTDLSHSVGQVDFRCSSNQSRPGEDIIYAADGSIEERINDGYDFDRIENNSLDSFVKNLACGEDRSTQIYPSITAFIQAGRPSA